MKLGTKETKEMLLFTLELANAIGRSLEDGELTIGDATNFVSPLMDISSAFSGASEIPKELSELDDEAKADILAYAKETFDIPQKDIEKIIECAFDNIFQIHSLVKLIIAAKIPSVE